MRKIIGAMVAVSMMALPVAANAGTRASDVVPVAAKIDRASPSTDAKAKKLEGENGILIAILAAAAVVTGIIIIASDDDDDGLSDG